MEKGWKVVSVMTDGVVQEWTDRQMRAAEKSGLLVAMGTSAIVVRSYIDPHYSDEQFSEEYPRAAQYL